jgi:hypothetical protein
MVYDFGSVREDPSSLRADGGQRTIDPAAPFSQLRVLIFRAQHDLDRPGAVGYR